MCGRFYINPQDFIDNFNIALKAAHDVFPHDQIFILTPKLETKTWGYRYHERLLINARYESYKNSIFAKFLPCAILASGYYEWNQLHEKYYFYHEQKKYLAGIYQDDEVLILTQPANNHIHHRMPILLTYQQAMTYCQSKILQFDNDNIMMDDPKVKQLSLF